MRLLVPILIVLVCFINSIHAQTCRDVSVELRADVEESPPSITLNWYPNASATAYFVYRKLKNNSSWGAVIGNLPGDATQFHDSTVNIGVSYEYRVIRQADAFTGYGYINSGIRLPEVEKRGLLILVVDSTFVESLSFEIDRLTDDLIGDGWRVQKIAVSRDAPVTEVKTHIIDIYSLNPGITKALFLLGHVPVPYSGEVNVDGHLDHTGAYPADVYYGDVNGIWTDNTINNTTASDPRNHNVPEDGKFDQGLIPSDVDLQVGRVDFYNMPSFGLDEEELLRAYLDKDHAYRHKHFTVEERALIDDNFGYFGGEAFAASGWKNAGPLVGPENVMAGDYFPDMTDGSYLWSYGCGGGWYQGAGGVGSTANFAASDLQSVFTMLFGSYFGDWDTQDNFLRAALAQGKTLTNVWSGRPHWEFHHMGMGENIGYDVRVSQNNSTLYNSNFGGRIVHMTLLGDPTLRNHVVGPPGELSVSDNDYHINVSWKPSADTSVTGYHLYRKADMEEDFTRVNAELITDTFYTDSCLITAGTYEYMVRALSLQYSQSGTYYNMSQGMKNQVLHSKESTVVADVDYTVEGSTVTFTNSSTGDSFLWLFGDGESSTEVSPVHEYIDGSYTVTFITSNACDADTMYLMITLLTAIEDVSSNNDFVLYPNPTTGEINLVLENGLLSQSSIEISTAEGFKILKETIGIENALIDLTGQPPGLYLITITGKGYRFSKKLILR